CVSFAVLSCTCHRTVANDQRAQGLSTLVRAECLLMGSSWLRSAFTCQSPRTADSRLWHGGPKPRGRVGCHLLWSDADQGPRTIKAGRARCTVAASQSVRPTGVRYGPKT